VLYSRSFDPPQDSPLVRHRCRNPKCGAKLKLPVTNSRDAFCAAGCFTAFYRRRCLVCERAIIRGTERQILCGRQKCKGEFRRHKERFFPARYPPLVLSPNALGNPIKSGLKIGTKRGRPFRQIAGPELSPRSFHLATLPLGPETAARVRRVNEQAGIDTTPLAGNGWPAIEIGHGNNPFRRRASR
jgi:hypothetical protein